MIGLCVYKTQKEAAWLHGYKSYGIKKQVRWAVSLLGIRWGVLFGPLGSMIPSQRKDTKKMSLFLGVSI
jgi:hypothetical protein